MSDKDDRWLNLLARTAAPVALALIGVGYFLGDSRTGKVVMIVGVSILLGGGFLILILLAFSGIANIQSRSLGRSDTDSVKRGLRERLRELWLWLRRGVSDASEKSGFRPRTGYDNRVLKKGILVISTNESGVALSAARPGIRISRALIAASAELGDGFRRYRSTISAHEGDSSVLNTPLQLPLNRDRTHTTEVNVTWHPCTQSEAHDVLMWRSNPRGKVGGDTGSGIYQNGDGKIATTHPFFYELSGEYLSVFNSLVSQANQAKSGSVWYDREVWENLGIERWKGNSGSRFTVDRKRARVWFRAGSGLEVTRDVVSFRFDSHEYAILPDSIVVNGKKLHSLSNMQVVTEVDGYIIPGKKVPKGSVPRGYTWEFVNKDGSPDLRYNENPRLAIIDVLEMAVAVDRKVLFAVVFSNVVAGQKFAESLVRLGELARSS